MTMPTATLAHAIEHLDLFGRLFRRNSWARRKVFLRTLFGERLDAEELAIFQHHTERVKAPIGPFREAALVCGRRAGKSRILAIMGSG
jgi:hypothetical protein